MNSKIPPFYIVKTLLGYGGGPDLNRISLIMPNDSHFTLVEMGAPRTQEQINKWHKLAIDLNNAWNQNQ